MAALTVKVVANIMPPCGLLRGACGPAMIFAPRPLMVSSAAVPDAGIGRPRLAHAPPQPDRRRDLTLHRVESSQA